VDAKTGYTYLEDYLAGNGTAVAPPPTPAPMASPSGTTVTPTNGATIVDAQANSWTLGATIPVASNADGTPNSCGNAVGQNGNSQNGTAATLLLWFNNARTAVYAYVVAGGHNFSRGTKPFQPGFSR
jgi:hypothetical protein